jgi:hypothetical protein
LAFFRKGKGVKNWSNLPMGGGRGSKIISLKWMVPKQNRQKNTDQKHKSSKKLSKKNRQNLSTY